MAKAAVMQQVKKALDGLEARQQIRNAARHAVNQTNAVYDARRKGLLCSLERATDWLLGIPHTAEEYYGCTILNACGVTLGYGPDGILQWSSRQKTHACWQDTLDFSSGERPDPSSSA